ncbi:E3 ubiquitin-protein ligase WAV3-like [Rosa sericea]
MSSQTASDQNNCGICLSSMATPKGQAIFTAQCSHSFHYPCIVQNVRHGNLSCPICRAIWDKHNVPFQPNNWTTSPSQQNKSGDPPHPWGIFRQQHNLGGNSPNISFSFQRQQLPHQTYHQYSYQQPSWNYPSFPFVQQPQAPPEPTSFSDDEPLLCTSPIQSNDPQAITIKTQTESLAISAAESHPRYPVLVSICAPSLQDTDGHGSTPVDLVTVLDVSGSMCGLKLDLVKRAVKFIIQNLGPSDRLSIVTFSTTARRVFPLRRMSVEGRESAVRAVNSLRPDNMTNIVAGLEIGIRVLEERRERNPVASIMLLSDGVDSYCHSPSQLLGQLPASIRSNCMQHEIPVHTFGFGSDHDPNTMHAISNASGGTFSFIESVGMIQDSFALCIGGLLSVVAQEVRLTVRSASRGVKIVAIPSGRYVSNISDEGLQGVVDVGSLYAEEEKQFLVYLLVPQSSASDTKTSLLDVSCLYRDLASNELIQVQGELVEIPRPVVCSPADQVVSLEVDRQRNRILVSETIAEAQGLAEIGNLEAARAILAQRRETLLTTPAARAGDGLSNLLETELQEIMDRMATMDLYTHTGRAYALSGMSSHSLQRATTRGDTTTSCLSASFGAAQASYSAGGINYPQRGGIFQQQQQQQQSLSAGATPFASPASLPLGGAYETSSMVRMVQKSKDLGTSYTK